jgi:hypothetical protein
VGGLDERAADRFTGLVVPLVDGTVAQVGTLAEAYLTVLDGSEGFTPPRQPPVPPTIRGGTPTVDVYHRAVVQARVAIANGRSFTEAMRQARNRATSTAQTDVMLANRQALDNSTRSRPWITGYRRVLTGRSCVFCATASTQRYKRANLAPLHPVCDCDIAPIYGTADPGQILNRPMLDRLKARGPEYWKDAGFVDTDGNPVPPDLVPDRKVEVYEHGELGPTLADSAHAHTGIGDL